MATAIERLADPDLRGELADGAVRSRSRHGWERTTHALGRLIG
jgi:hypothetical protein